MELRPKKRRVQHVISILLIFMVLCSFFSALCGEVKAEEKRIVKVAFFPMDGYHEKTKNGDYEGMDVEYLDALCEYTNWEIQYVDCGSWDEALDRLEKKQVDLVGSAQYSAARAEKFCYADLSSGYTYGAVAVDKESTLAYEDFDVMKAITYGVVKTYVRKGEFLEYLKSHDIGNSKVKEFDTTAELVSALENGQNDEMVHTLTEIREGQRLIGRFAPMPFYYISYYGNEDLMLELNQAIADVKIKHPELETSLMNKYYQSRLDSRVFLTLEEQRYVEQNPILTIGYLRGQFPFSYEEDGQFMGLSKELIENSLEAAGFIPEYHGYQSQEEAIKALHAGEVQMLAYCGEQAENLVVLKEYAEMPLVVLMEKENGLNDMQALGTVQYLYPELENSSVGSQAEIKIYDTQSACLKALEDGVVDAVLCSGYLAQYMLSMEYDYLELEIKTVLNSVHQVSAVMSRDGEVLLKQIAQKIIPTIDTKQINEHMLSENMFRTLNLRSIVRVYSIPIIVFLLLLIGAIVLIATRMVKSSMQIQNLMYKDTRMDIWNLNYFYFWGEQKLLPERKDKYAVVVLNISQFRRYNIIFGWDAGEELLTLVANVLLTEVDASKEIRARHQGDRFVLLLAWEDWEQFQQRIVKLKKMVEQCIYSDTGSKLNVEFGVYAIPQDNSDLHEALNCANQALDFAGKDSSVVYYDNNLEDMIMIKHEQETLLETVEVSKHFVAYYQPKVDIRTEKIIGAEALVRFMDPTADGAIRAPGFFVPYFEQTGKIMEIDFFVLESTCRMLRRRMDEGKNVVTISCNFSRKHFLQSDFPERFEQVLDRYGIPKEMIEVEITETLVVEELQYHTVKKTLEIMKQKGIRLSIDDFGAGYSSLGIFEQIPASVIKLDRSFLLNKENRERQVKIMRGIVMLGRELEAQIVCEGVETEDDIKVMREIGAYVAQGYFYSKPVPEAELEEKLDI